MRNHGWREEEGKIERRGRREGKGSIVVREDTEGREGGKGWKREIIMGLEGVMGEKWGCCIQRSSIIIIILNVKSCVSEFLLRKSCLFDRIYFCFCLCRCVGISWRH